MAKLELEIRKVAGVRAVSDDRQADLRALAEKAEQMEDDNWSKLSDEAQTWVNNAMKAINDQEDIKDFGAGKKSASRSRAKDEADAQEASESEDTTDYDDAASDEDTASSDDETEGGNDVATKRRAAKRGKVNDKKAKAGKSVSKLKSHKSAELPPEKTAKKAKSSNGKANSGGTPTRQRAPKTGPVVGSTAYVKQLIIKNTAITTDEVIAACKNKGLTASPVTIRTIASDFRHSMRVLHQEGCLKNIRTD